MASDYFLKIDGIKGESTDDKHKDSIELQSFSWGLSNAGSVRSDGGGGVGKVNFQDISFMKRADTTSPQLMLACASGKHIQKVELHVREAAARKSNDYTLDYMKITLENVMVSSFQQSGVDNSVPTDQFSLNFAKIEYSHARQGADGNFDRPVVASWDLATNKKA